MQASYGVVLGLATPGDIDALRKVSMIPPFDIFRVFNGEPLWLEDAVTLDNAIARVRQLGAEQSGEYFVRSKKTDVEISVTIRRSEHVEPDFDICSAPLAVRHRPGRLQKTKDHLDDLSARSLE